MNEYDSDLQREAEGAAPEGGSRTYTEDQLRDLALYRQIFDALSEEPIFRVSPDFAARVSARVQRRRGIPFAELLEWVPAFSVILAGGIIVALLQPYRSLLAELSADTIDLLAFPSVRAAVIGAFGTFLLDRLWIRRRLVGRP